MNYQVFDCVKPQDNCILVAEEDIYKEIKKERIGYDRDCQYSMSIQPNI
jgi:hypothetical protein